MKKNYIISLLVSIIISTLFIMPEKVSSSELKADTHNLDNAWINQKESI